MAVNCPERTLDKPVMREANCNIYLRRCRLVNKMLKQFALSYRKKEKQFRRIILVPNKVVNLILNVAVNLTGAWVSDDKANAS